MRLLDPQEQQERDGMNRVNKGNRQAILDYARDRFDEIASVNGGRVGLISLWNVQFELENFFGISDYQSQKLTMELLENRSVTA